MAETLADLAMPPHSRISVPQFADARHEPALNARLRIVREIEEDEGGVTLHFQQGGHGRLAVGIPEYAKHLQLAQRSQARQHPVGVRFDAGHAIAELMRADNDVPAQLLEDGADRARLHFQGHDGIFFVRADHAEFARIRTVLLDAIRLKTRVWFVARKLDLALLDVMAVERDAQ